MDAIIVAIIFSVPGIIVTKIDKRLNPKSFEDTSEYEKTIMAIPISAIILIMNVLLMNLISKEKIYSINTLLNMMNNFSFLAGYMFITIFTCLFVFFVKMKLVEPLFLKLINRFKEKYNMPTESKYPSEWEKIFENDDEPVNNMFISIEKDGKTITQGLLAGYSPPNQKNRDISLIGTKEFKEYLLNDSRLDDDEKLVDIIKKEYYDFNTGILIKIYDNSKLLSYFESQEDN